MSCQSRTPRPWKFRVSGRPVFCQLADAAGGGREMTQRLEQNTDNLSEKLEAMKTGLGGLRRVGAGPDWIHKILPIAISDLHRNHPRIRIDLTVTLNDELRRRFDHGEIDLFFASVSDAYFGAAYRTQILLREKMHVVARRDHPIYQGGLKTLEEVATVPW